MDNLTFPLSSKPMTLTLTSSPSLQISVVFSVRAFCNSDIWTNPSFVPRKFTNAPKSTVFTTFPVYIIPNSALYLISDLSSGVTGNIHHVDGGLYSVAIPKSNNLE